MITVLFFGPVAERMETGRIEVDHVAGMRLADLRSTLAARHPEAFEIVSLAAVNGEHVRNMDVLLGEGSEVVFMSKFSGG